MVQGIPAAALDDSKPWQGQCPVTFEGKQSARITGTWKLPLRFQRTAWECTQCVSTAVSPQGASSQGNAQRSELQHHQSPERLRGALVCFALFVSSFLTSETTTVTLCHCIVAAWHGTCFGFLKGISANNLPESQRMF